MKDQNVEETLILIKPDAIKKSLTGNIISKLSSLGYIIIGAKVVRVSRELAEEHYAELKDKPFFSELIKYIQGELHGTSRIFALVYQGPNAISKVRELTGSTNPEDANPNSIRGSYGRINQKGIIENVVHASANKSDAVREIKLWFREDEVLWDAYEKELS
ncbi:MAG: nucleoside-diphosphate kinase [bacterium]